MRSRLIPVVFLALMAACEPGSRTAPKESRAPLTLVDSVELQESDSVSLGAPGYLALDHAGSLFVSDVMSGQVVQFARDGKLVRRIGTRGGGPGEFRAPLASAANGDSLLAVADIAQRRVSLFNRKTGEFIRSVRYEGYAFWMQESNDTVWIGSVNSARRTSFAVLPLTGDSISYLGPLPREYEESPLVRDYHPYATLLRMTGDTVLLGFTGHHAMFLMHGDGTVFDTVEIPAVRRRGVPRDIVKRLASDPPMEEVASMVSALFGLHRLPSNDVAALYLDVKLNGKLINADGYLSILSRDLRRACIDIPMKFSDAGRPTAAFKGDTLFIMEQSVEGDRAVTYVKAYRIDPSGCEWTPVVDGAGTGGRGQ